MSQLKHYNIVLDSENLLALALLLPSDKLLIDLHAELICSEQKFPSAHIRWE